MFVFWNASDMSRKCSIVTKATITSLVFCLNHDGMQDEPASQLQIITRDNGKPRPIRHANTYFSQHTILKQMTVLRDFCIFCAGKPLHRKFEKSCRKETYLLNRKFKKGWRCINKNILLTKQQWQDTIK